MPTDKEAIGELVAIRSIWRSRTSAGDGDTGRNGNVTVKAPTAPPRPDAGGATDKIEAGIDPYEIVQSYPGPALLVALDGAVIEHNEPANDLAAALKQGVLQELAESFVAVRSTQRGVTQPVCLPEAFGDSSVDLAITPIFSSTGALAMLGLFGRTVTLENNLRNALVESRQRYKDLVECSSDFAWETDRNGEFVFVSPKGVLGLQPDQLVGRPARAFILPDAERPDHLPFESEAPTVDEVMWMRAADGAAACIEVSSLPLFDATGVWCGARGISRDITESRAVDLALETARRRERTLDTILRSISTELDPRRVLSVAAEALHGALDDATCWILRFDDEGTAYVAASMPEDMPATPEINETVAALSRKGAGAKADIVEVGSSLFGATQYASAINGAVAVKRGAASEWSDGDRDLLAGVVGQLGLAIEQLTNQEKLELLSRTDGLTGLLNRRAFDDEVQRRVYHAIRNNRPATLFFVDLDNFKAVNDMHGHAAGDAALRAVSDLLVKSCRGGDILGRVGGDEFAVWLDETNLGGGRAKAEALVADDAFCASVPVVDGRPFALSIGMAAFDPRSGENLAQLIERADRAMYEAKRDHGAPSYFIAPKAGTGGKT